MLSWTRWRFAGIVAALLISPGGLGSADPVPSPHQPGSVPVASKKRPAQVSDEDRAFWSFRPLQAAVPPAVKNSGWVRTGIDRFILAKLEEKGISPRPAAEKRQLIRRAYFDLIGLPPSPEDVERFAASSDPESYEKLLDQLLTNPHYGERWGRHWLDVARFAESHGFEHDYDRPYSYHYRDFVIQALNRDLPGNQFLQWQLAGDEFAPNDPLALMATGFLGAGVFPTQITANEVERTRYDALDDMSSTMGTAMLGLTVGCARCHDHKFDPIPASDYYRLLSTFTTTVRTEVELDLNPKAYREARAKFEHERAPLAKALDDYEKGELSARFMKWLESEPERLPDADWIVADRGAVASANKTEFRKLDDGSFLAGGSNPDSDSYAFRFVPSETAEARVTAVRIEALADDSLPHKGPGRADNGNFALSRIRLRAQPPGSSVGPEEIRLDRPVADFEQNKDGLSVAAALDDQRNTGWAIDGQIGKSHAAVFHVADPAMWPAGTVFTASLDFGVNTRHAIGRLRVAFSSHDGLVPWNGGTVPQSLRNAFAERGRPDHLSEEGRATLLAYFKRHDAKWLDLWQRLEECAKGEPRPNLTKVQICSEGANIKPMRHHTQGADFFNETYFLNRGSTEQKNGVATQSFLQVLMRSPEGEKHWQTPPPEGSTTSYRRRSLANWITDVDAGAGHLAARVMVNRLWQHHFGRGIVATPNDFGTQGLRPSNPELLDWLAARFIRSGWSLRQMHKLMMSSAAYMQASLPNPESERLDPLNEWCGRRVPQRLEAEVLRDSMLRVSGQLDETMFGPGALDPGQKRRSIYFTVKRSQLVSMMQLFDAPEPLTSVGSRPATTIAPQALLFLNGPLARQCAAALGARLRDPELAGSVDRGFQLTIGRHPTAVEMRDSIAFLEAQTASYGETARAREMALVDFAQTLLGLNEFIYVQ